MESLTWIGKHWWQLGLAVFVICGAARGASVDEDRRREEASRQEVWVSDLKGQYEFAGGRLLTITGTQYRLHAQLDGHPDTIVVRVGPSVFQAADGSFTLTFRPLGNGTVLAVDLQEGEVPAQTDVAQRR
nr:hypothetical protein [uncultured Massilia sp.]